MKTKTPKLPSAAEVRKAHAAPKAKQTTLNDQAIFVDILSKANNWIGFAHYPDNAHGILQAKHTANTISSVTGFSTRVARK